MDAMRYTRDKSEIGAIDLTRGTISTEDAKVMSTFLWNSYDVIYIDHLEMENGFTLPNY